MTDLPDSPTNVAPELLDAEALFRNYRRFLYALALRRLEVAAPNDHAFDVDDLAQEISVAVLRGRHYYRPERGRLTTWLARMALR
jgi:DNA-directed RNA polymerase specialized sigma24 family protein